MKAIAGLCKASVLSLLLHALHSGSGPSALPDPRRTPGAVNPAVTQANIDSTICVQGWTRTVRPPERYTESLKRQQMREYGYTDHHLSDFEEDHLIPLELAGALADPRNLWPEPHVAPGGWGSRRKDYLENRLHRLVCEGACRSPRRSGQSHATGSPLTGNMQRGRHEAPHRHRPRAGDRVAGLGPRLHRSGWVAGQHDQQHAARVVAP
jgi:hypothetical protein